MHMVENSGSDRKSTMVFFFVNPFVFIYSMALTYALLASIWIKYDMQAYGTRLLC